jgi:hypothetical protein
VSHCKQSLTLPTDNAPGRELFSMRISNTVLGIAVVAISAGLLVGFASQSTNTPSRQAQASATPGLIQTASLPADQQNFIDAVTGAREAYRRAANDMAKGAARVERSERICQALRSFIVQDWIGRVHRLSSNNDGRGVLALKIGPGIYTKTWNNAVSDFQDGTLLAPGSQVYRTALSMHEGDVVLFSGKFFRGDKDCAREASLTIDGSMTEQNSSCNSPISSNIGFSFRKEQLHEVVHYHRADNTWHYGRSMDPIHDFCGSTNWRAP